MMRKRVFISSVIAEYIENREAVAAAVRAVNCEVIRSEDFNARPETPQQACLNELRMSDIVVFALGATYGKHQSLGLSATHEEWREATKGQKPILIFVEKLIQGNQNKPSSYKKSNSGRVAVFANRSIRQQIYRKKLHKR